MDRKKSRALLIFCMLAAVLLTACEPKAAEELLDFQSDTERNVIICGDTEYLFYGFPKKSDRTEQIGTLDGDEKDKIYSFRGYPAEEFVIEYYESGLMDNPSLYRADGCEEEPEGVEREE